MRTIPPPRSALPARLAVPLVDAPRPPDPAPKRPSRAPAVEPPAFEPPAVKRSTAEPLDERHQSKQARHSQQEVRRSAVELPAVERPAVQVSAKAATQPRTAVIPLAVELPAVEPSGSGWEAVPGRGDGAGATRKSDLASEAIRRPELDRGAEKHGVSAVQGAGPVVPEVKEKAEPARAAANGRPGAKLVLRLSNMVRPP